MSAYGFPAMLATRGDAATRPGEPHNAAHCGAQTRGAFSPRVAALLGDLEGDPTETPPILFYCNRISDCRWIDFRFPLAESPSRGEQTGRERNRVRAPQWVAFCATRQGELVERPSVRLDSGTRRAAKRGGFLFGYFFLATQEKVTRHQAKNPASHTHSIISVIQRDYPILSGSPS